MLNLTTCSLVSHVAYENRNLSFLRYAFVCLRQHDVVDLCSVVPAEPKPKPDLLRAFEELRRKRSAPQQFYDQLSSALTRAQRCVNGREALQK
jgi:hypothetical protein